ncbi:MAG TPA: bifunctional pyr operon transcriptional regulator/uracil phosphoribosyltransferase PyrR [Gemmatimonadales bacterium]
MPTSRLLDEPGMGRALQRMADEVIQRCGGGDPPLLVGIQRRGVYLADRLAALLGPRIGPVRLGKLDITLYRDDLQQIGPRPIVGETSLPPDINGQTCVIVDDVLYTGRTIRAALDEFADFGRPRRIMLAVLVDRGGRELPIQPEVVGMTVETGPHDRVDVAVRELDGFDAVDLVRGEG